MKRLRYKLYKLCHKYGLVSPKVIVLMDGGICSQMHQFLLGQLYLRQGYTVAYDLEFYKEWGSDLNCLFVRNYDLEKAFPYLKVPVASFGAIQLYKKKYYYSGNCSDGEYVNFSFLDFAPPIYLGGYYHLPPDVWLQVFHSIFVLEPAVLDQENRVLLDRISCQENTVAVHVRRGDLSIEVPAYGRPASADYFQNALSYFMSELDSPFFYFFSDEPDWVINCLIPQLHLEENYSVVDINGSDKGYMDLFLIASCKHQVTSKGSLGKFGAILGDNLEKKVVLCDDKTEYDWKELLQNPIFL